MSTLKSKYVSAPVVGATVEPLVLQTNNLDRVTVAADGTVTAASGFTDSSNRLRPLVSGTAKAWNWNGLSTNKEIDFLDIPSWAKRITVMFSGVSTSGTSNPLIQLGTSSGATTSGYTSRASYIAGTAVAETTHTTGFGIFSATASNVHTGCLTFTNISGNTWICSGVVGTTATWFTAGLISLSATLDRIRVTTVSGADNFDAGTINIMWE